MHVHSEQIVVERKTSAPFPFNQEVSQCFDGLLVNGLVLDVEDGLVEELGGITTHLRWLL